MKIKLRNGDKVLFRDAVTVCNKGATVIKVLKKERRVRVITSDGQRRNVHRKDILGKA